jgi:hypothetical protein
MKDNIYIYIYFTFSCSHQSPSTRALVLDKSPPPPSLWCWYTSTLVCSFRSPSLLRQLILTGTPTLSLPVPLAKTPSLA